MEDEPLIVPESLDRETGIGVREEALRRVRRGDREVAMDLGRVTRADTFGVAALLDVHRVAKSRGATLRLRSVPDSVRSLFAFLQVDRVLGEEVEPRVREPWLARLGASGIAILESAIQQAVLNLDALYLTFIAPLRGKGPRGELFVRQLVEIGVRSVPIVTLICFLIGTIMALQAAYVLRTFGANIFVANLVGVSVTRELGPLMAAIIVAARCGSSIAAEIGTMVVTEEVDAIKVMALDPKRFLVAPRFAAMVIALPCLVVLADIAGIAGGFTVAIFGLDIGFDAYWVKTIGALHVQDVLTGLVKAFVFANVIAVIACHRGLLLRGGPEEVGRATTRSVVLSIVFVILSDFVFTSLFFLLD